MYQEAVSALSSLKILTELGKGILAAKTLDEARARTVNLQAQLLEVQASLLQMQQSMGSMQQDNIELRRDLDNLRNRQDDLGRYELMEFPETKAIAYRLKQAERELHEPDHYACASCYKKGQVAILQPSNRAPRITHFSARLDRQQHRYGRDCR